MTLKGLVGFTAALTLLLAACGGGARPNSTPAPASQRLSAATNAPTPASARATTSPVPAATVASPIAKGPPEPNPLPPQPPGGNKDYEPVAGIDVTKNGPAVSIRGSVAAGQVVYAQNCQSCHGVEGKSGLPNPGSDDGTVPALNPIDPGFIAKGDPAVFANAIDLFVQHGSRPAGANPAFSMIPWGDQGKLTQQQIADVEAYLMQLNGVTWPGG